MIVVLSTIIIICDVGLLLLHHIVDDYDVIPGCWSRLSYVSRSVKVVPRVPVLWLYTYITKKKWNQPLPPTVLCLVWKDSAERIEGDTLLDQSDWPIEGSRQNVQDKTVFDM